MAVFSTQKSTKKGVIDDDQIHSTTNRKERKDKVRTTTIVHDRTDTHPEHTWASDTPRGPLVTHQASTKQSSARADRSKQAQKTSEKRQDESKSVNSCY